MSNDLSKPYKFTITNGVVTSVYEYDHGRFKYEGIDRNESYTFDGVNVTKTEYDDGRLKTSIYSDTNGDGIFYKTTQQFNYSSDFVNSPQSYQDGYQFTVTNGAVTSVSEIERGVSYAERIDNNEKWSVDGANFVKSEFEHGVIETTVYSDLDGDGVFTKTSKSYLADNGATWNGRAGTDDNDRWEGTDGHDAFHGGIGSDYLKGGLDNDDLYGGDGDDHLVGNRGADYLYGGDGHDRIEGNRGFDHVEGGVGDDSLIGGMGNDELYGGDGDDLMEGGIANDHLVGNLGADYLYGGDGQDIIEGNRGLDYIEGGVGDDSLIGGMGADEITGGLGNDTYIFRSILDSGFDSSTRDRVVDFEYGDKIDLSAIDAKTGFTENDSFSFIGNELNLTATNANGAIWVVGDVVYGSTDFDTSAEFSIQLVGVTNITASDFVF